MWLLLAVRQVWADGGGRGGTVGTRAATNKTDAPAERVGVEARRGRWLGGGGVGGSGGGGESNSEGSFGGNGGAWD